MMYRYITLNGDIYMKMEPRPITFWTKERKLWGLTLVAVVSAFIAKWRKA